MAKRSNIKKFREFWETHPKLNEWLDYENDGCKAFCKYCETSITCKLSELFAHAASDLHLVAYNSANTNKLPTEPSNAMTDKYTDAVPVCITHEHLNDCCKMNSASNHSCLCSVENLNLAKCLAVISMYDIYLNETIAQKLKLSHPMIEKVMKYKDHIKTIFKYVPKMKRFITPNELNKIIAITEILREFMWRLTRQNVKITDEELMLNARLLAKVFCVTGLQIDDQWKQFFRKNFEPSNPNKKPIITIKQDFYVRNILKHVQHRLDSEVVAQFNEHLRKINSNNLILVCSKTVYKQYVDRKQTSKKMYKIKTDNVVEEFFKNLKGSGESEQHKINNPESGKTSKPTGSGEQSLQKENSLVTADRIHEFKENTDTTTIALKEESEEFFKMEEIKIEEYSCIVANKLTHESQVICMYEENEFEEYMINDDSNEMIEIYEVIDEDDNDNDKNLIVPENANPEYKATKTELDLEKIKQNYICDLQSKQFPIQYWGVKPLPVQPEKEQEPNETNVHSGNNENYRYRKEFEEPQAMQSSIKKLCVAPEINPELSVIYKDDHDDVEKSINLDEQTKTNLSIFNETQYKMNQEFYVNQENINPECVSTETEFYKYSQEVPLDQIKEELIELNANEDIRQGDQVFEEPQAIQTLKQLFYVEPEIKQEPDETNQNVNNNGNYRGLEEFEELQTIQYSIQNSSVDLVEPEIKEEPDETNSNTDSNDIYRDREKFEELKKMQSPIRNSYEEPMEPEAALEQKATNINSDKNDSYKTYAVISENYDNENSMILEKQIETNLTSNETQHEANQDYYTKKGNKNLECNDTEAEFRKYSQETNDADSTKTEGGIINKDTALSYLAALQAYVVVNGHFQAIELLDKVDCLLREQK